jgi:hypothetical protein
MLTVDQFARIRQLRRDGLTIRQIADQLQHSPKTILKALDHPEPPPARTSAPRPAPVFGLCGRAAGRLVRPAAQRRELPARRAL